MNQHETKSKLVINISHVHSMFLYMVHSYFFQWIGEEHKFLKVQEIAF